MLIRTLIAVGLLTCFFPLAVVAQQSLDSLVDSNVASLVATYKMLHAAPELSHREEKTSAYFANELR